MKSLSGLVVVSRIVIALLFFAVAAVSVHAQGVNGTFTGTVMDAQGAAVAGADVTIINVGTNDKTQRRQTRMGCTGFRNFPSGPTRLRWRPRVSRRLCGPA